MSEQSGLLHSIDADGVLRVVFDLPGQRVNLFTEHNLQELSRMLDEARARDEIRAVLFASAKPGMFIAGLDVDHIESLTDAYKAAEASRFGQAVFQKIAALDRPTACAINGICLGAGAELALACGLRVAANDRAVRIGLPEVQLGIIPGFGGTQRLPRRLGLSAALDLILSGRKLDAAAAKRAGLVDLVVPPEYLEREALALLRRATEQGEESLAAALRGKRPLQQLAVERIGPLRRYVIEQARKRAAATADRQSYPAPFRAIEAIEAATTQTLPQGLDFEARLVGELIPTRTSKNLIWLFKNRTALRSDLSGVRAVPREVRRLAVLGAGLMGGGIAQLAADRGIPVRLKDVHYEAILAALRTARGVWNGQLQRKTLSLRELKQRIAFIAPTSDDSGLRNVDLAIEAVAEELELKQRVLAEAEQRIDERAVFASNTSSLAISDIAARARRPERVVGLHFFNPVHRMPLVEVIAGVHTSPEAVATAHIFARRLGKVPVIVRDEPGFLVNRVLALYLNEALRLLAEGVRMDVLDRSMLAFGMPMGPFALLDQIGLDTARHVAAVLRAAFGERVGTDGFLLDTMVSDDRLGQKNGKGFYRYRNGKRTVPDPRVYELAGAPAAREIPAETLQERMVLAMLNEAAVCLQEGVVRRPREIDVAMVLGTGFPPFRGGLLRHADEVGIPIIVDRLERLADAHGDRFRPALCLQEMVPRQDRFYRDS
jgi:3-hydroxyacyl-CoA dehydrogenase/enoyl-CoA hydratase/3-hydroxybutyryl-CoA epimerase